MQDKLLDAARIAGPGRRVSWARFDRGGSRMALRIAGALSVTLAVTLTVMLPTPAFANGAPLTQPLMLQNDATSAATADVAEDAAEDADVAEATGVVIVAVDADGPAAQAGIVRGDILMIVDEVAIDSAAALYGVVVEAMPGDEVMVGVQHGDELRSFAVSLGQNDDRAYLGVQVVDAPGAHGLVVLPAGAVEPDTETDTETDTESDTEDVITIVTGTVQESDVDEHEVIVLGAGLFVAEVMDGSPAAQAGLAAGDLLLAVDGEPVMLPDELVAVLAAYAPSDEVMLRVQKGGLVGAAIVELPVTLGAAPDDATRAYLGIRMAAMPANITLPAVPSVRAYAAPAMPTSPEGGVGYMHPGLRWMPHMGEACGQGDVIIQQYFLGTPGLGMPEEMPYAVPPAGHSVPQSIAPPVMPGESIFIYRAGVDGIDVVDSVMTVTSAAEEEHVVVLRDSAPMGWTMAAPGDVPQWVAITTDAEMGTTEVEIIEFGTTETGVSAIKVGEIEADEVEIDATVDAWY